MEVPAGKIAPVDDQSLQFRKPARANFLLDRTWWRDAFGSAWSFAPQCVFSATALTIGNLIVVIGSDQMQARMRVIQVHDGITQIEPVVQVLVIGLVMLCSSLALTLWSLSLWLAKLTIFARAMVVSPSMPDAEQYAEAAKVVRSKKLFFARVWLVASAYLIIPVFPLALLLALKTVSGPEFTIAGTALVPLPAGLTPSTLQITVAVVGGILSVVALAYSTTTLVLSSISEAGAGRTATAALTQCFKHAGTVLLLSFVVTILNVIVGAPSYVLTASEMLHLPDASLVLACVGQVWLGVSSVVMWPLSVAPFCELMRSRSEETFRA